MLDLHSVKDIVKSLPVKVSERSFRLAAKRLDKNYLDRAQMMVDLNDVPTILKEIERCRIRDRNKRLVARR